MLPGKERQRHPEKARAKHDLRQDSRGKGTTILFAAAGGGTVFLAAPACQPANRAGCPLNAAARAGHLLAAAGGGNNSFGSACMPAGESGRLPA